MSEKNTSPNELSPQEKRRLLEKLLSEKAAQGNGRRPDNLGSSQEVLPAVHRIAIPLLDRSQKYFPLSSAQQRLWLLDQIDPGNPIYNISLLLRLKGNINLHALEQSLLAIQDRHEILRVNYTTLEGKPVQFLEPDRKLSISIVDLKNETGKTRVQLAEGLAEEQAQRPFDLAEGGLVRANLFRLADNDNLFQFVIHHIIFDGWSLNVFLHEFTSLYSAISKKEEAVLPDLSIQYIDYAGWETSQFEDERIKNQVSYWKKQLAGNLPVLEMPLDKPRPNVQSFSAGRVVLEIPQSLTRALNALSKQEGVTLYVTMLSVFYILLGRYTTQEDIIIGTPIARRTRAELEKLIGVFINNLALRTDLSGNISFRELLKRVRRTVLDAFEHQEVPFEKLLTELRIDRDPSRSPVFQVFFNLLDLRKGLNLELPNVQVETPSLPEIGSIFDLTLYVQNWGETIKLKLVYNADLFHNHSMVEFLNRYTYLLEQVTADPNQSIFSLPLPNQARQRQTDIIQKFSLLNNDYRMFTDDSLNLSIANRFECQVEKFHHRIAIKTTRHEWTYSYLNRLANRTAHSILRYSKQIDGKVALLFDHDAPMVAGLLGALKAGKTYIPLDPHYPPQRLAYMLEDSQASLIITDNARIELAQELAGDRLSIINIDQLSNGFQDTNPCIEISPDTLAYILYTSGSTGQPKGVMQNHRNVLHFIKAYTNNLYIGPSDRLTLISSYSFDAAVMDIFGALLNGAALYPIDVKKEGLFNLAKYLKEYEISIYHSTPTVYRYFLNSLGETDEFPLVRLIVLGGEAVVKRDVDLYKTHFSRECVFINGLGPTESTVSLQYFVDQRTEVAHNSVPVGFPVEETEVLFLNESGQQVPLFGEIAIRSPYVALGYWQKPEITGAAFLSDSAQQGVRTYRTGDMGSLLPDGTIEFRGRRDFQVKIRGHRVEVGEVEARLAEHPSIQECVVDARDDENGTKHLVAYFVQKGSRPSGSELRRFLQQKLPDYMIPSTFASLSSLPLTPTGKIDRRALPEPDIEIFADAAGQVAARNETEERLVKIWEDLLQVKPIGIQQNFFELGGHSLLAVHMFSRINQDFGINLPLATLFREATIEYLAEKILKESGPSTWSSLIEIESQGEYPPFFCVHGLTGDILWFRDLARCLSPHYPFYGLQSRGLDGIQNPLTQIEDMASHYINEIRLIQPKGPYLLGGASFGGTIALEIAQQLLAQGENVAMLAIFDHSPPNIQVDSDRGRLKQGLLTAYGITTNFPNWLKEFAKLGPSRMLMRVRRKLRLIRKAKGQTDISKLGEFDAQDLIDFAGELSEHRQQLITCNYQALKAYSPKAYPGRVTLFRAQNRPLLNTFDPESGWQVLAPGRVDVHDIPSSHEGMFTKPYVDHLAERLKMCFNNIQGSE